MFTLITANRPLCGNGPLQFSIFDDIHEHLVLGSLHVVFVFENSQRIEEVFKSAVSGLELDRSLCWERGLGYGVLRTQPC